MATKKYRVDTDQGSYEVEVEDSPSQDTSAPTLKPGEATRQDTNMIGVDHDAVAHWITDKAAKYLPDSMAPAGAALGTFAADIPLSILEMMSSPEGAAVAGAGGPKPFPMHVSHPSTPIRDALRAAGTELRGAPGAGVTGKMVGSALERIPVPKTFQDLPLSQQMESLPNTPAPEGRMPIPPQIEQKGFNDLPLAKQMSSLPMTAAPEGRMPVPPQVEQRGFNDLPLAQQMEHLPATGASEGRIPIPPQIERQGFNDLPLSRQMDYLPSNANPEGRVSSPPIIPQTRFNDLPLHEQMRYLNGGPTPETGRVGIPPYQAPSVKPGPMSPRIGGKALSLEDALAEELSHADEPMPTKVSLPPDGDITPGGPFRQSGKFGKSGNLGQAGGYSSGNPATPSETRMSELINKFGGRGETAAGPEVPAPPSGGSVTPPTPGKPVLTVQEVASLGRRMYGSRDAGGMLYGQSMPAADRAAAIQRLAPGPSQIPLTAEARINAASGKAAMEPQDILGDLLAQMLNKRGQP